MHSLLIFLAEVAHMVLQGNQPLKYKNKPDRSKRDAEM